MSRSPFVARSLVVLAVVLTSLVAWSPPRTVAQLAGDTLATSLGAVVARANLGPNVGVTVLDASTGNPVFEHQSALALNPASNQKLITAAAALSLLGAEFRMRTALHGVVEGDAVVGGLYLRGYGDPGLRQADLMELVIDLARRGVRRVDDVVVDASYFDDQLLPPAFEQQPREVAPFRSAIGAVSLDANAYLLRVRPGASGAPAIVELDGEGYFVVDSQLTTVDGGPLNVIADQRADGERMRLVLRGTVPTGGSPVSYARRIENPLAWSGHVLRDLLARQGIRVGGSVRIGATPPSAPLLTSHQSRPLAQLLSALGKQSDNFTAEMVFRVIGAEAHRPGRSADAVTAVQTFLRGASIDVDTLAIVNGSGLFQGNRVPTGQLARLLSWVYRNPAIRDEYVAHLAIGGVDGTLANRLRDLPAPRVVRAKTGTLNDAIALSGYVLGRTPGEAYAFSVIANGIAGHQGEARTLCDDVARTLANQLWVPTH